MELSVVVPTLNGRRRLVDCLDALQREAPDAEVIVVNGPSADGTTGAVRDRDDVAALIELADRNVNVARNAGLEAASGDAVAFVDERTAVDPGWFDAVATGLDDADAITGPVGGAPPEHRRIAGREVRYFDGGNVAFARGAVSALDGFDEYLAVGGARDAAHRLAGLGLRVSWEPGVAARREGPTGESDWAWKYRSLAYRLAKNYGVRPTVIARTVRHALADGVGQLREVAAGGELPSAWIGQGRTVLSGLLRGTVDGLAARRRGGDARNPNGVSSRTDRAVRRYDWR